MKRLAAALPALLAALASLTGAALAAGPSLEDFATGLVLVPGGSQPVQELALPDAVYDAVTRADLGDLRVFNSAGIVVPHALCVAPRPLPAEVQERPLTVFALAAPQGGAATSADEIRVESANGAIVTIREPRAAAGTPDVATDTGAWIVDAGEPPPEIRSLKFAWTTADGAAELAVRVEASDDLDTWRTVVPRTTLLRTTADGQVLERSIVNLPTGHYRYLRFERGDRGPPPRFHGVTAEVSLPARPPEPFRFAAAPLADVAADGAFLFESGRLAPVHTALVQLPAPNMSVEVELDSRSAADGPWQRRWSGRVSSIQAAPAPETFAPVSDPYWRVRVLRGAETLGTARPALSLGYHPARLQFAAQGDGPWLLAFGSARAPRAEPAGCNSLAAGLSDDEIGQAAFQPAPAARFGGSEAYVEPAKPTPVRRIVLWGVLLAGAALLAGMAMSLRRKLAAPRD